MKGVMRFGKKGILSTRYIGPYKIIRRVGQVAYELELPQELSAVYLVFDVSMLRKCVGDPSYITPIEDVQVTGDLTYEEVQELVDLPNRKTGHPAAIGEFQVDSGHSESIAYTLVLFSS
ncbi:uncharacterized protein LOC125873811 [Solanum stenotomum]|uniref:uncharacterized protein LOC125873811 n=1 Tax=Solanum stenotomum TaxID=172797 RepID=UPI0020D0D19D|nr:uncharacterized protein LOC125873811 [Solanum stenotomum]